MTAAPTAVPPPAVPEKKSFGRAFWCLNTIEMWERLAYYSLRVMAPIYIVQADDPGGLHLTARHKGSIYFWWAIFQSLLPMVTGGIADRYGYKRTLGFSFTMMTSGYVIIALGRDVPGYEQYNYHFFLAGILVLAFGTAFFKPAIQGSLAQSLHKGNSSLGWSIFYWIVNVGAFVGHFLPLLFLQGEHTPEKWRNLFLACAALSSLNFLMLLTFTDVPSGAAKHEGPVVVLIKTITNLFEPRLLVWLLIMSGFWMMMYQLWDAQPNFIADWIDSRPLAESLSVLPDFAYTSLTEETPRGRQIPQNVLLSLNSVMIILGVVGVGWLTRSMRTLTAMTWGMLFCTAGLLIAGLTMSPWILLLGIVFFSLGEMTTGPKKSEYLALIAPPGKKGLYLGYVNIPVGIGVAVGSEIAGIVYDRFGEKASLALRHLQSLNHTGAGFAPEKLTNALEKSVGVPRTEAVAELSKVLGKTPTEVTQFLWDTYTPQYYVWIPFAAIGVLCAIALYIYGQMAKKWNDMNA